MFFWQKGDIVTAETTFRVHIIEILGSQKHQKI
jgi:hypothetical protein